MITAKSTGRKNRIIGTVKLGRQGCGFLLGLVHARIAALLGEHAQGLPDRRAVALGLDQGRDNGLDRFEPRARGEIFIRHAPLGEVGQFRRGQGHFLGQFERGASDFGAHPAEGLLHRTAGFRADQQQIKGIRPGPLDRGAAFVGGIA